MEIAGRNVLAKRKQTSPWPLLLRQFASPLIVILLAAGSITGFLLHQWVDATIIGVTVIINTFLGFFQEYHAERSFEALEKFLTPHAKVIRNGKRMEIDATTLVPGDIVILEIGRTVPADGELIEATDMSINEAILTGESMPIHKQVNRITGYQADLSSLVFMGTTVVTGIGKMRVTAIGQQTKMGEIASSLASIGQQETPLQHEVRGLAGILGIAVVAIALFIFSVGSLLGKSPSDMFKLSVAVAVSAIPEGLAVSLTAILAIGMQRILKRKALVRKLVAAETLGSVTVICTDKTGTLTEGKMRVTGMDLIDEEEGKNAIAACNDLRDPLEVAMFNAVKDAEERVKRFPRLAEIPFSPSYKYIATLNKCNGSNGQTSHSLILFVSGAPEVLLERSTLSEKEKEKWLEKFRIHAREGMRLVAVAKKEINAGPAARHPAPTLSDSDISDLTWLGVVLFEDPVREGVAESLAEAQQLGLKINIVTGDYRETTEAVIRKLKVQDIGIYARVTPEQKLKIVEDLKKQGEVVAMMGDGVNDAPALKAADISIVVASASDVAKQLADVVLLDNNFSTIISSILEGRGIFRTFKKVLSYLLSDSFAEVILVLGAFAFPVPLPLTAVMILWINLITDGFPSLALAVEPHVQTFFPRGRIVDREVALVIGIVSFLKGAMTLGFFLILWQLTHNIAIARSAAFAMMVVISLSTVFPLRSLERPMTHINLFSNRWLLLAVGVGFSLLLFLLWNPFLQRSFGTTMLGLTEWVVIFGAGMLTIGAVEVVKAISKKRFMNYEV